MKRFKMRLISAAVVAVMGITGVVGCGFATLDGTKTVITINGEDVPLGVASFSLRYSQAQTDYYYQQLAAMYQGAGVAGQDWDEIAEGETKTNGELTKDDVMNRIKKLYEVRAHAKDYGVELGQEEKDRILAVAKEFIANNEKSILSRIGVTESNVAEYLELETYYKKAYEPMIKDKEITVTDEEASQSTISYTFLSTNNLDAESAKNEMEMLLAEYKEQEDIAALDMEALTAEKEAGFMATTASFGNEEEEGTGLDEAVKEAARTLKDGELYPEVIEGASGGGYFIIRMDKVKDEDATAKAKEAIETEKKQEAFNEMVDKWVEEADIKIDEKVWREVKLINKDKYVVKVKPIEEIPTEPEADLGVEVETEPDSGVEVEVEPDSGVEVEIEPGVE